MVLYLIFYVLYAREYASLDPLIQSALKHWSNSKNSEAATAAVNSEGEMPLHLFDNATYPNARCLDGTMAGYYYALNESSPNWVIYLEGGGLCVEPIDCKQRMKKHLGSSNYWSDTHTDSKNMCSSSPENPFHTWNRIFVPYCTGDVHIGVLTKPDEYGFHFSGHHVVTAVIDHLFFDTDRDVAQVIFSGESAGGIGTMHNADFVGERLSKLNSDIQYWASPQGGFYFPSDDLILYPEMVLNMTLDFAFFAGSYLYEFFGHPFLDESCTKARPLTPHQCWNQAIHYKHIDTDLFIAENMYDSNQIGAVLGVNWFPVQNDVNEYKTYFGATMKASLESKIKSRDGLFMPSCYEHTANLCMLQQSPMVENRTYAELLTEWLYQSDSGPIHYIDTCDSKLPCNSYCKC